MLMLGLDKTIDQLAITKSVCKHGYVLGGRMIMS